MIFFHEYNLSYRKYSRVLLANSFFVGSLYYNFVWFLAVDRYVILVNEFRAYELICLLAEYRGVL